MSLPAAPAGACLRVLVVDDEALARVRLRGLVGDCLEPRALVVGEAGNAVQALAWLAANRCDLVLLDVQMPGRDGTQLAADLRALREPPAVVFVTAHAQHALRAFDLDAVDYLTKPVRRERLHASLQRVAQRLAPRGAAPGPAEAMALAALGAADAVGAGGGGSGSGAGAGEAAAVIVVSDRGRVVRVPVAEALYFKAELKYVTLRTADHSYVLDESLSELEQRLGGRFLRVHRNALVARHAVRALERHAPAGAADDGGSGEVAGEGWAVRMAPVGEWLAVSRRQVAAVREALIERGG